MYDQTKNPPKKPHTKKAKISITSYEERFFSKYWVKSALNF